MRMSIGDSTSAGALAIGLALGAFAGWIARRFAPRRDDFIEFDSDDEDDHAIMSYGGEECKLVFCVRTDLKMTKGKIAAQVGHATLGAYKRARRSSPAAVRAWESDAQPKIALAVNSSAQANALEAEARRNGLPTYKVHDAGRTQIAAVS